MIRLSRKSEYGLLAIWYLRSRADAPVASAKEIAAHFKIPHSILAKVMQRLKRHNVVRSEKGMSGGYELMRPLSEITFLEFLGIFEEETALVECMGAELPQRCEQLDSCSIRDPISALNDIIQRQLSQITLEQMYAMERPTGVRVALDRLAVTR